jgi:hypothetical protein
VRGHGELVSELSSWIYQCLLDKMNSLDGAGVLPDLNRMLHARGFDAITTAAVVSHYVSDSTLYYSYAGHPPVLARRSGGRWLPLVLDTQSGKANLCQANLPLGVLSSVQIRFAPRRGCNEETTSCSTPTVSRKQRTSSPVRSSEKGNCRFYSGPDAGAQRWAICANVRPIRSFSEGFYYGRHYEIHRTSRRRIICIRGVRRMICEDMASPKSLVISTNPSLVVQRLIRVR